MLALAGLREHNPDDTPAERREKGKRQRLDLVRMPRVQGNRLDREHMQRMASSLGVEGLLPRAFVRAA